MQRRIVYVVNSAVVCSNTATSFVLCRLRVSVLAKTTVWPRSALITNFLLLLLLSLLLLLLKPTSTKPHAEILTLNEVNGCNDVSFGDHSVLEGDRIPHWRAMGRRWTTNSVSLVSSVTTVIITIIIIKTHKHKAAGCQKVENRNCHQKLHLFRLVVLRKPVSRTAAQQQKFSEKRRETSRTSPDAADICLARSLTKMICVLVNGPRFRPRFDRSVLSK